MFFIYVLLFQAVTFELKRLSGIKSTTETGGESSKPKSGDLLPESLAKKVGHRD